MIRLLLLFAVLAASGCATGKPARPLADETPRPQMHDRHGRVVRVEPAGGYVVLECTFLPSAGEEITLFRDREGKVRSRVRASARASGSWVVADIIEGEPRPGDWYIGR